MKVFEVFEGLNFLACCRCHGVVLLLMGSVKKGGRYSLFMRHSALWGGYREAAGSTLTGGGWGLKKEPGAVLRGRDAP
jgi:hypothetical protein